MRKLFFLFFVVLVSQVQAQSLTVLDSLDRIYRSNAHDTTKILALAEIAYLNYLNFDTCMALSEKSIAESDRIGFKKGKGRCFIAMSGSYYRAKDNYFDALEYASKALKIAEDVNDEKGKILALNVIGLINFSMESYTEALSCFQVCI